MKRNLALMAFLWCWQWMLFAQNIPDVQDPPRLVNDFAGILDEGEVEMLEKKLLAWKDSTSSEMSIVTIKSLEGMDVADYSVRLAEKWKIGTKKNNGVLLLVAIKERKSRIEVGYGLEGKLTDVVSRRILADYLKPAFKERRYYDGLNEVTDRLIEAASGEYQAENGPEIDQNIEEISWTSIIIFLIILFLISRGRGGGGGGFLTGMLLGNLLGGGRRSSWGDFSSGSGSFGGFGGGSFGGGGASGDW
jgi:uncharacterized protein